MLSLSTHVLKHRQNTFTIHTSVSVYCQFVKKNPVTDTPKYTPPTKQLKTQHQKHVT